ncbi:hypothetical protein X777_04851 [Ooceraea biroi]|uniref:Uncharacterized protein n=1 Tax=Ooceraea biroi TaxID=2015173 RepID=A0A026WGV5_OOCBI|nr:hypothetical protein X777_04851 [Ooceraea biroi]
MGVSPLSDPLTAVGVEAPTRSNGQRLSHTCSVIRPMDRTEISVVDNRKHSFLHDRYSPSRRRQELSYQDPSRC